MYRKVPQSLLEGSQEGRYTSWVAILVLLVLFVKESHDFLTVREVSDLSLDRSNIPKIQVNFNISLLDLRCDYATINVVSVLGNEQNITKDISRRPLSEGGFHTSTHTAVHHHEDKEGILMHDPSITESLEELHMNGQDVVSFDQETLQYALDEKEYVFVKYYADWCSHCRNFAPTWEKFAEVMHDVEDSVKERLGTEYTEEEYEEAKHLAVPVLVGQVDCVEHHVFCNQQGIRAYPTVKLFVNGEPFKGGEYHGHRTVVNLIQFVELAEQLTENEDVEKVQKHSEIAIQKHFNMTKRNQQWLEALEHTHDHAKRVWSSDEHPGCQISGTLHLNRAPGHFYIQAKSMAHDLDPRVANLSHVVHHLSFESYDETLVAGRHARKKRPKFSKATAPLDETTYVLSEPHESWHHYLKLVSTNTDYYHVTPSHQLALYRDDRVTEAKFILDISPIAVHFRSERRPWYDYVTSVLAIVGGTFTVVGMVEWWIESARRQLRRSTHRRMGGSGAP